MFNTLASMRAPLACICALTIAGVDGFLPAAAKAGPGRLASTPAAPRCQHKLAELATPTTRLHNTHRARSRVLNAAVVDKELDEAFVESMNDVCTKVH
jgi:hypothetical protein